MEEMVCYLFEDGAEGGGRGEVYIYIYIYIYIYTVVIWPNVVESVPLKLLKDNRLKEKKKKKKKKWV